MARLLLENVARGKLLMRVRASGGVRILYAPEAPQGEYGACTVLVSSGKDTRRRGRFPSDRSSSLVIRRRYTRHTQSGDKC